MIERTLENTIVKKINQGKAILVLGARQVGKTTLLNKIFGTGPDVLWLDGGSPDIKALFESSSADRLKLFFGNKKIIILDEAQLIPDIGSRLKLIIDHLKDIQLIATGSSSFELANHLNEPLTGRKWEFRLYPLSFAEMANHHGLITEKRALFHRLVYGYYPDVINHPGEESLILKLLTDSYLYKDILMLDNIKKPDKIVRLLQALAYQIGNQVSYNELGQLCGLDNKTTEKYITLLEQAYIIYRLGSFSRNLRNELKHSRKIYFFDNGVRNALIANFNLAENRPDAGALWENFVLTERIKKNSYSGVIKNSWFWRTTERQEIDLIEDSDGTLTAFEFKLNSNKPVRISKSFINAYPETTIKTIHPGNMEEFIL